jgi:hypothetical protein
MMDRRVRVRCLLFISYSVRDGTLPAQSIIFIPHWCLKEVHPVPLTEARVFSVWQCLGMDMQRRAGAHV